MTVTELRDKLNKLIEEEMVGNYNVMYCDSYRIMDDVSDVVVEIEDDCYGDYVKIK